MRLRFRAGLRLYLGDFVNHVIQMSQSGIDFVFGKVGDAGGPWGFIFAVKVLPIIIFFSALMSVLYYVGIMQRVVAGLAWALRTTLRVTGAEATCMAGEHLHRADRGAPFTVKPLIAKMTRAQLMLIMLGGFAHIAGSVLGAYVMMLGGDDKLEQARYATHLIGASLISAPAAIVMARIIMPETETPPPEDPASLKAASEEDHANLFDAAAGGATTGLKLALNIAAMLIAFVSLLALINWPLHARPGRDRCGCTTGSCRAASPAGFPSRSCSAGSSLPSPGQWASSGKMRSAWAACSGRS